MRALVVYESLYGNTHAIADAIAVGLQPVMEVEVVAVAGATAEKVAGADLLVVGGPTHVHGMTSGTSRSNGIEMAAKDPKLPPLDADATGPGLREWFHDLPEGQDGAAAAFDTRFDASMLLTGAASHGIAKRLRKHGFRMVSEPESFLVDKATHLLPDEAAKATRWGAALAESVASAAR
jgi:hypothetical protein